MRKALVTTVLASAFAVALWQGSPTSFAAAEQARLRTHFDSVERELRARDVPGLTASQRAARARLLNVLRSYRLRGVFPRNTDFPDRRMPTFIDYWGKRCGVAYLMEQTGNEEMVLRIAATENNARVPELKDDPEVGRWLAASGITLAEATRIQPDYRCGSIHGGPCPVSVSTGYKLATGAVLAGGVTTFTLDALSHSSPASTGLGLASGLAGIMLAVPYVGDSGARGTYGAVNLGVGAASLMLGFIKLARGTGPDAQSRLSFAPWVGVRGATGLAARVTF